MITVEKLARAIEKRLGRPRAEALREAERVLDYFGFRTVIIDNAIQPEDRKLFYALHDAKLLQSSIETAPLLDGRNWRIFYWELHEADVTRAIDEAPGRPSEPVYESLPDEAWSHPSASA